MPNILFLTDDDFFADDLSEQIKLYAPEFDIFREEDKDKHYHIIVVDEKTDSLKNIITKAPVFLLTQNENTDANVQHIFTKPLKLRDFLDTLQAGINRFENSSEGYLTFNRYELRPMSKEILNLRNAELIKLTEKEVSIIKYLYKSQDRIVSKNELLQEVWGYSPDVTTHTIETHIYRLRQKVEHDNPDAQIIITEEGGYLLKI